MKTITNTYDGIITTQPEEMTYEEAKAYAQRARSLHGNRAVAIILELTVDGYVDITTALRNPPFDRIRRITGYLTKTSNMNQAKYDETCDRTTHGTVMDMDMRACYPSLLQQLQ